MRSLLAILAMLFCLTSCYGESFYTSEAEFQAGAEPGTYMVKVHIKKVTIEGDAEREELIAAPGVTAKVGQEGKIEILGGKTGKDIILSSFYPANKNASPIRCSVELKENGKTTYRTKLNVRVNGIP